MDKEWPKFITDHEGPISQWLDALKIKIRTGQIALLRAFIGDPERDATQRITQEGCLQHRNLACGPIRPHLMEHQQRIGAIAAIAEAVIGQNPVMARFISHRLNARKALDWLANEREGNAGLPIAMHRTRIAHYGARRVNPCITRTREFTGNQRITRRICRRQGHGEGRQNGVPSQGRFKALIRKSGAHKTENGRKQQMTQLQHGEPFSGHEEGRVSLARYKSRTESLQHDERQKETPHMAINRSRIDLF